MVPQVVLVDVDPRVVVAWQATFEDCPEVEIVQGSILDQRVDAWVSPTNALGNMDGGVDGRIRAHLGERIQQRVHAAIRREHGGAMAVGRATCVKTGRRWPTFLISTPTMVSNAADVSETMNVALACAAAFHAAQVASLTTASTLATAGTTGSTTRHGALASVAIPGLGASTGKVSPETCATLMWMAYRLCRDRDFASFDDLRHALEDEVGSLEPGQRTRKGKRGWLRRIGDFLGLGA